MGCSKTTWRHLKGRDAYYPVDPRRQADTLPIFALTKSFHAPNKEINIFVDDRLLRFQSTSAEGWRELLSDLMMSHGVPLPYETTVLVVAMIVDLGLWKALQTLFMSTI